MKKAFFFLSFLASVGFLQAQIVNIPADYLTIQQGIDAAYEGDTVLVQPGIYTGQINFSGKAITVGSLYLTTQDTAYISQTVINATESDTAVIIFNSNETPATVLCGFRITNDPAILGKGISCFGAGPALRDLIIDGATNPNNYFRAIECQYSEAMMENIRIISVSKGFGLYIKESDVTISSFNISGNSSTAIFVYQSGLTLENGLIADNNFGISCNNSDLLLKGITIKNNQGGAIGSYYSSSIEFDCVNRCNIFSNGASNNYGSHDIRSYSPLHLVVDTFSVLHPTSFYVSPIVNSTFDILNGRIDQVEADVFVSPQGSDSNSGLSPADPFKTIRHASGVLLSDSLHPRTIHLLEGNYSFSSNGEVLPVLLFDYISLDGVSRENVIIEGEDTLNSRLIYVYDGHNISVSGMSVMNGLGIHCKNSSFEMENMAIMNNHFIAGGGLGLEDCTGRLNDMVFENNASLIGGGLFASYSDIKLENISMVGNYAFWDGGGICLNGTLAQVEDVSITDNNADQRGGGIAICLSDASFNRVILENNQVPDTAGSGYGYGGAVYCDASGLVFRNTLFYGNSAKETGTVLYCDNDSHAKLVNVTLTGNEQMRGFFGSQKSLISCDNSDAEILNSIIFFNDTISITLMEGDINVNFSNTEGPAGHVWYGEGNINEDPLFEGSAEHPYQLSAGSPSIDAGNPDTTGTQLFIWDLIGNYRFWDGDLDGDTIVDMGAYEFGSIGVKIPEFNTQHSIFNISCYPNPTSEIVHIEYEIKNPTLVSIQVFNVIGERVAVLSDGIMSDGKHQIIWNAASLPAGLYFVRLIAGKEYASIKLIKQ